MTCQVKGCPVPPDLHEMEDLGGASLYARKDGDLSWVAEFAGEDAAQLFLRLPAAFHALAGLVEAVRDDDCEFGNHRACDVAAALAAAEEALRE